MGYIQCVNDGEGALRILWNWLSGKQGEKFSNFEDEEIDPIGFLKLMSDKPFELPSLHIVPMLFGKERKENLLNFAFSLTQSVKAGVAFFAVNFSGIVRVLQLWENHD